MGLRAGGAPFATGEMIRIRSNRNGFNNPLSPGSRGVEMPLP